MWPAAPASLPNRNEAEVSSEVASRRERARLIRANEPTSSCPSDSATVEPRAPRLERDG